jgi:lipopolysaccharide exporter
MDEVNPLDRPTSNLTRHTLSGLQWAYLGTAIGAVLQLGMGAVMARLLTPTAFGLVALAGLFLRFVTYFAKAGITQALVQKPSLVTNDVRAAFVMSVGLSSGFAVVVLLGAPWAARFAQDPDLVPVLRWLVLGLVLQGIGGPSVALLRRDLRFKTLAVIEVGSYVIGYVAVGLAMALLGAGVFALVGAMLTQSAVSAASAYLTVRHSVLPTRARESYRAIFGFGARVSVVGFFEFLQSNLDVLAIGRWAGSAQLGLYSRARLIGDLPAYHLINGLSQVLFPSFSAIQLDRERLKRAYVSALGAAAALILPLNAGMAVAARELVLVLLGPQWTGAIEVMPWLLLAGSLTLLGQFAGLVAQAQAALNAKIAIAVGTSLILVFLLVLAEGGPLAFYGAAVAGAAAVSHLGYIFLLTRTLGTTFGSLTWPYIRTGVGAAVVAAAIGACRLALNGIGTPVLVVLSAEALTGAVVLAVLLRFGLLRPFRDDFARRLTAAGILGTNGGTMSRAVAWLVGPPAT